MQGRLLHVQVGHLRFGRHLILRSVMLYTVYLSQLFVTTCMRGYHSSTCLGQTIPKLMCCCWSVLASSIGISACCLLSDPTSPTYGSPTRSTFTPTVVFRFPLCCRITSTMEVEGHHSAFNTVCTPTLPLSSLLNIYALRSPFSTPCKPATPTPKFRNRSLNASGPITKRFAISVNTSKEGSKLAGKSHDRNSSIYLVMSLLANNAPVCEIW